MTTRVAPASRWSVAFSRLVYLPVDSTTTSIPNSLHGSALAIGFGEHLDASLPTIIELPVDAHGFGVSDRARSLGRRVARVLRALRDR